MWLCVGFKYQPISNLLPISYQEYHEMYKFDVNARLEQVINLVFIIFRSSIPKFWWFILCYSEISNI